MDAEIKEMMLKYALQNAVKYNGKANKGAIIGKVLGERPELKGSIKELSKEIDKIVREVNSMGSEKQKKKLEAFSEELPPKENKKSSIFDFMNIREGEEVVTAFPPEPSKYPHIGHAKAIIMNYELAKTYNGTFILRFEDTNPSLAEKDFYEIHLENYKWLGIKPDKIDYASDCMDEFYAKAEQLIKGNNAYMCICPEETAKENRFKGTECRCRYNQTDKNLELWNEMKDAKQGKMVLRLKGYMQSTNTTMRDPALMRIIDEPHPRTKKKYRIWPTYDFENSVMDGIEGTTHRLRSKEFELRSELQGLIQSMLGLPQTKIFHFARFNLEGVESSGRIVRELVKKKKLIGWDDPSLTTLVALRRRGFLPEAVSEFVRSTGITKTEAVLKWDDLIVHNRRLLDPKCDRYFFVEEPVEIEIENAPKQTVELKLHPDFNRGVRKFSTTDAFYISKDDFKILKNEKLYRLMDCLNFKKAKGKFIFDSLEIAKYRDKGEKIMHWLPAEKGLVDVEILMPDKIVKKGFGELSLKKLSEGDTVQFVRVGFAKLDKKEKGRLLFWFTHQ